MVNGGRKLKGKVAVQGSKNATLPILASSLLHTRPLTLRNVPDIEDVRSMLEILKHLGATYTFESNVLEIDSSQIENKVITDELSNKLRASSLLIGPLIARFNEASVGMPGGCSIGPRPLNFHFDGLEHLNTVVTIDSGIVKATTPSIQGDYTLEFPSVGATQNLINASVFSKESVIIRNIAIEPEVMAMIEFLTESGANIEFLEQNVIKITGVERLKSIDFTIPPDRIEAGTLLVAGFMTKGDVVVKGVKTEDLSSVLQKLHDMGAIVEVKGRNVHVKYDGKINETNIRTGVHPAFPTDMQSQFSVLMTRADGPSFITETIFNNRFRHLDELSKMNGEVTVEKELAVVYPSQLSGARVSGFDLRGTASMILAGLVAKGVTRVDGLENLYRGYENLVEKLNHLGADIYYID